MDEKLTAESDPILSAGVALITGSGSGIGQSVALGFAKKGCTKLFIADISTSGLDETRRMLESQFSNVTVATFKVDVGVASEVQAMVDTCVQTFGRLDFAVNNAGISTAPCLTEDQKMDVFDKVITTNTKSVFLCHKYQISQMLKQEPLDVEGVRYHCRGSIVNISSLLGLGPESMMSVYSSSKHAVVAMTHVDARDFAARGIRINCVCPGTVDTAMVRNANLSQEFIGNQSPMKRIIHSEEISEGVVFLSGSGATAITGVSLPIDTGAVLLRVV